MKVAIVFGVLVGFVSTAVFAEGIRWKPETLTPGDYISIDQSQGGLIHHVFSGKAGRSYIVESYRGSKPSGKPVFTTYLDKDGNQVRWVRPDGFELRFRPHDCTRTLGRCQYTQTGTDGKRETRLRLTEATRMGFKFSEYSSDGKRLFFGQITLDEHGNAGNGRLDGNQGKQRFRLVGKVYQ
ncbi:hypothetical protein PhaeoP23_01644 [Phaeobacter piscinae]|uniref:Uncharacterized protein n=1 Tax=Phaeobacter piscinae TaxID=1580596 RepID=A0ABM6PE09_9RHOB|nr:hypothetical protein [Phaeobacter piscinae]ATG35786.1 hypothetical protein PhaeoP36_01644 [Phaeobacter piscinae]AUQ86307.1 hypothetical protein PhaeoP42_01645 [Phaeobacter piscinae]AUR24190.1 hypothetical protein PhaeoP23_01644 [Phaeobacter piscinae]